MEQHAFDNQRLAEARPEQLRALILDYLCHNCYTKTAQAFSKDSVVRHLDLDGDEFVSGPGKLGGTFPELSEDMIRAIAIRERIRTHILSGEVEEATIVLNEHFPAVLDESLGEEADKILSDDATSDGVQYRTVNVNPVYVALNLRILAFIEACRTTPLDHSSPISYDPTDVDFPTSVMPLECDPADEERHQMDLLIKAQKLYAHVNSLQNPTSRAVYQKELNNVGGLLAYKVPEKSPIAKYLSQERRERVAEQIDCAILHSMNMPMPTISYMELAVRHTHCLWAALHTAKMRLPPSSQWPVGVLLPPSPNSPSPTGSQKEPHEVPLFDLQRFLNTKT